jgi:tRNA A-37 threonylcarbamoyl transferase component Bud32
MLWLVTSYIQDDSSYDRSLRSSALKAVKHRLKQLWKAGISHGDVAWRNVVILKGGKDARLIDLGRAHYLRDAAAAENEDLPDFQELVDVLSRSMG